MSTLAVELSIFFKRQIIVNLLAIYWRSVENDSTLPKVRNINVTDRALTNFTTDLNSITNLRTTTILLCGVRLNPAPYVFVSHKCDHSCRYHSSQIRNETLVKSSKPLISGKKKQKGFQVRSIIFKSNIVYSNNKIFYEFGRCFP